MNKDDHKVSFGSAKVLHMLSEPKHGTWLSVEGRRENIVIRVTPGGRLRISKINKNIPKS